MQFAIFYDSINANVKERKSGATHSFTYVMTFSGRNYGKQDVAARIEDLLNEYLTGKELEIYNIEYKKEGKDWKLRIYLDKPID